ncbi:MAG: VOC family protein [Paludibaculum sp.]
MSPSILGIHHITAIAGDPQKNIDFYTGLLGLRLVKTTVNFDDPGSYHFYYGDGAGSPGTIMTFFTWPGARRGRRGAGQVTHTSFAVPPGSLTYWDDRLRSANVEIQGRSGRLGRPVLSFLDGDGLSLELIEAENADPGRVWTGSSVPSDAAIHGFHSATISVADAAPTVSLLKETMGFRETGVEGDRIRLEAAAGGPGQTIDVLPVPSGETGRVAVGTVHHIAWRTPDDAQQLQWLELLERAGYGVSPVMDRSYFHSIYYREHGGVLFEIATDQPGFATDESVETLGTALKLPAWMEPQRNVIEQLLPVIQRAAGSRRMTPEELGLRHRFVPGAKDGPPVTLVLLHGTGGTEDDLIGLGRELLPGAALLSPRGKVLEHGMPRSSGVWRKVSSIRRIWRCAPRELSQFVEAAKQAYGLQSDMTVAVGYSNGANIAASVLLTVPEVFQGAVLFRAMVPFIPSAPPVLEGVSVLLAAGERDPIVETGNTDLLNSILDSAGADVSLYWHPGGHELGHNDLLAARRWMAARLASRSQLAG